MRSNMPAGNVLPYQPSRAHMRWSARFATSLAITGALILLWLPSSIQAGPRIVEERAQFPMPGLSGQGITGIGMNSDSILVATRRNFSEGGADFSEMSAYLYRRAATGQWHYAETLMRTISDFGDAIPFYVAMEGNVGAVLEGGTVSVYEPTAAGGWARTAQLQLQTSGGGIRIDAGTIVTGKACSWEAFRKNTASTWVRVGGATVPLGECINGSVDVSGSTVVVGSSLDGSLGGENFEPSVRVYSGLSFTPTMTTVLSPHGDNDIYFGSHTAVDGSMLLTTSAIDRGISVFRRNSGGQWDYLMSATPADAYRDRARSNIPIPQVGSSFAVAAQLSNDHRAVVAGAIDVFRRNTDGTTTQTARLLASDAHFGMMMGLRVAISGQRIAAAAQDPAAVYVFELPSDLSQPALVQENFQTGNGGNWTPIAGSSFSVVSAGTSRVYRQSSVASGAGSYLTNMDWKDQSIQADVRPTAFDGPDRWFGLAVRRTDAANYYYVTVRSSNAIDLKRMRNGSFVTLASAPLPVQLNRNYRLRVEAVGTWIRAYVDGALAIEARDSALTHGQAGVQMYKARADYDNIVISPNAFLPMYADNFELDDYWWTKVDGSWSRHIESVEDEIVLDTFRQSSTASGARAVIGVSTGDQVVQTRARAISFAGTNVWFGVMGRYVDSRNYYYITLRNNGTLSLRKLVNDNIVVLGTASLPVTPNTWYNLRLDAIGNSLRAYVNGELRLEATDTSFPSGRYGLVTYKTAADYDALHVSQP